MAHDVILVDIPCELGEKVYLLLLGEVVGGRQLSS